MSRTWGGRRRPFSLLVVSQLVQLLCPFPPRSPVPPATPPAPTPRTRPVLGGSPPCQRTVSDDQTGGGPQPGRLSPIPSSPSPAILPRPPPHSASASGSETGPKASTSRPPCSPSRNGPNLPLPPRTTKRSPNACGRRGTSLTLRVRDDALPAQDRGLHYRSLTGTGRWRFSRPLSTGSGATPFPFEGPAELSAPRGRRQGTGHPHPRRRQGRPSRPPTTTALLSAPEKTAQSAHPRPSPAG